MTRLETLIAEAKKAEDASYSATTELFELDQRRKGLSAQSLDLHQAWKEAECKMLDALYERRP